MEWQHLLCSARRKDKDKDKEKEKEKNNSPHAQTQADTLSLSKGRQEIERDYDRLLFSAPTRRLADKTQVFPLDRNDSVRTRLTHSHEVANFARGIGMRLAFDLKQEIFGNLEGVCVERDVPALLAAIGLAHDLGNPPYGHQGEAAMRSWFTRHLQPLVGDEENKQIYNDFFKFDGNSQTFRLVTKLQILNDQYGLNLTYATLAALIKYPQSSYTRNKTPWKKQGFFHSEYGVVQEVWERTGLSEGLRHPLTYLMEACDDIAYSVLDAEDTVKRGLASYHDLINFLLCWGKGDDEEIKLVIEKTKEKNQGWETKESDLSPAELNDMSMQMFRVNATSSLINAAVDAFHEHHKSFLLHNCEIKDLMGISRSAELCDALKEFDKTRGYRHRSVLELELKGSNYIQGLMDMLWVGIHGHKTRAQEDQEKELMKSQPDLTPQTAHRSDTPFGRYAYGRISENYRRIFEDPQNNLPRLYKEAQLLTDAIAGMTDSYLMDLHDELKSLYEYERRQKPEAP